MPHMLRAVEALEPWLVTVENVEGLTYAKHRPYLDWFVESLRALRYIVEWRVLNTANYGVPQTRKRLIIVGRIGGSVRWPAPTHAKQNAGNARTWKPGDPDVLPPVLLPWVSMAEALGWGMTTKPMLTIASARTTGGPDAQGVGGSRARAVLEAELVAGRWVLNTGNDWKPGQDRRTAQKRSLLRPAPSLTGKSGGHWVLDRPATTVQNDTRVHPPGHRANADYDGHPRRGPDAYRLSVAELARLQDFPDGYPFVGTKTSQVRQIGNALPATLLQAVVGANLWPPHWPVEEP
jgi:DNA (cytosine-5)-methyltransferase 1